MYMHAGQAARSHTPFAERMPEIESWKALDCKNGLQVFHTSETATSRYVRMSSRLCCAAREQARLCLSRSYAVYIAS